MFAWYVILHACDNISILVIKLLSAVFFPVRSLKIYTPEIDNFACHVTRLSHPSNFGEEPQTESGGKRVHEKNNCT